MFDLNCRHLWNVCVCVVFSWFQADEPIHKFCSLSLPLSALNKINQLTVVTRLSPFHFTFLQMMRSAPRKRVERRNDTKFKKKKTQNASNKCVYDKHIHSHFKEGALIKNIYSKPFKRIPQCICKQNTRRATTNNKKKGEIS